MDINKFNSNTPVKNDKIKNEYNQYKEYNAKSRKNYDASEHIHNNVNISYNNLVNICNIHNVENASKNMSVNNFRKDIHNVMHVSSVSKTQINTTNHINNINNMEKIYDVNNINDPKNNEHNQKSRISDIVPKYFNNDSLLNDEDAFNHSSKNNRKIYIQNVHNKFYNKKKSENFNCSNNIQGNKKYTEQDYIFVNKIQTDNSEGSCINSKLNNKFDNLNSYTNTRGSILEIKNENNAYMNNLCKNSEHKMEENEVYISGNSSKNEKLCLRKFSTLNEIQKSDYISEKDNYNFNINKNKYDSDNTIANNKYESKENVEKYIDDKISSYHNVHYSKLQELRNMNNELNCKIKIDTWINKENDKYVYFNSINSNFKDITNIKITDKKRKNLTESSLNNNNKNYKVNIFNNTINCNILTHEQKYTEHKNDNYSHFIKNENIKEQEGVKCEKGENAKLKDNEQIINCTIIEKNEKNNITYKKMEKKENRNDEKNRENCIKSGEILLKHGEKAINENEKFSNIRNCFVRNKNKTIKNNKNICNYEVKNNENIIKCEVNLINGNKNVSKRIENLSLDHKIVFNNYQDNKIYNSYTTYNDHNTNNMNMCINNAYTNIKQEDEKKVGCNESQFFENYNIKDLCEYTASRDKEKNQLIENIYYDSKNVFVKNKENLTAHKNGKNKNSCYMNDNNFMNILKKNNNENFNFSKSEKKNYQKGSLNYYENESQNYLSQNKMICEIEKSVNTNNIINYNYDKKIKNEEKKEFKNIIQKSNICDEKNNTERDILKNSREYSQISSNMLNDAHINKKIKINFQDEKNFNNSNDYIRESVINSTVNKTNLISQKKIEIKIEKETIEENNLWNFEKNVFLKNNFSQGKYDTAYLNRNNQKVLNSNVVEDFFEVKNYNFLCDKLNLKPKVISNFIKVQQNELQEFLETYDKNKITNKNRENEIDEFLEIYDKIRDMNRNKENYVNNELLEIYNKNKCINKNKENEKDEFLDIYNKARNINENIENEEDEFLEIYDKNKYMSKNKENEEDEFLEVYDKNKYISKNKENEEDRFLEVYDKNKYISKNKENEEDEFLEIYDKNKYMSKNKENEGNEFLEIYDKNKYMSKNKENEKDEFLEIFNKNKGINKEKENEDEFLEIYNKAKSINENIGNEDEFLEIYYKTKNMNKNKENEDEFLEICNKNKGINKDKENEEDEFLEIYDKTKNINKTRENDEFLEIYDEINNIYKNGVTNNSSFMYTSRKKDKINDKISCEMKNLLSNDKSNLSTKNLNKGNSKNNSELIHFLGTNVEIYEENLKEMKNKLYDDKCDSYTNSMNSYKENKIDEYIEICSKTENVDENKKNKTDEFLEIYDEINNVNKNRMINNSSFICDLGKEVKINKGSLMETKDKLFNDNNDSYTKNVKDKGVHSSFTYASGKEVNINKEILKEMKDKLFSDDNDSYTKNVKKNGIYSSFTYASGKEVNINKDILKEMKDKLFSDDNDSYTKNAKKNGTYSSFTYASGKEANINKEILKEMKDKLFSDDNDSYTKNAKKNGAYSSFTYASGKEVNINKEILKEMKDKLFSDDNDSYTKNVKKNGIYSSFTYASGKEANINKDILKEMKDKLFSDDNDSYSKDVKKINLKNVSEVAYVSNKKGKIYEEFLEDQKKEVSYAENSDIKNDINYSEKKLFLSKNGMLEVYDRQNLKEQESYESEGYDEIMKKEVNLFKNENTSTLVDNHFSPNSKSNIKVSNGFRAKKDFVNPRQRKKTNDFEEKKINISNKNKELNLNINLRNHLKLIKYMYVNLSKIKKLKNNKDLTNTLMFTNENKNPYKFNWFDNDYSYFFKSRGKNEYYMSDINELYDLFILITKELKIFCTYDFTWFSKKYKLITMSLIRKYKKELRKKYKYIKRETIKKSKQDYCSNISYEEYYKNFIYAYLNENDYLKKLHNISDIVLQNTQEKIISTNNKSGKSKKDNIYESDKFKFQEDEQTSLSNNESKLLNKSQKCDKIMYDDSKNDIYGSPGIYELDKYEENKLNYKKMKKFNRTVMIIKSIDETEPPSPFEFIYKLLKRYIEEKKNKKCILQLIQENILTYKTPVNLRVEKIVREQEFIMILSDNFDYIYCMINDSYLKNLLISNKIKEGYILRINSFDLYNKIQQENEHTYFKNAHFILSSNNLIDIDKENQLKIGISKYKAKRIRNIQDFGSNCFFVDVIIISKSDFSYGFYDPSKKKFFLLNNNIYEKIVYNLKNEITKILHDENFMENMKYVKLKNDLNMYMEATPFCTIQAIDFASSEKIKETTNFDDKVQYIINSLCQIKMFKIDNETYENLRKGRRIQLFNVFVQKSNKNNKFSPYFDENVLDDLVYNTFQKKIKDDYMKKSLNHNSLQSYFLKEDVKANSSGNFSEYDNYIKCFNSSILTKKHYTPIVFQATHSTYINLDTKYKSKLFEELQNVLSIEKNMEIKENNSTCDVKEKKNIYPSFIYTNIYKIPVLSTIHMNVFKNSLKLNMNMRNLYFDLIQGNIYNISGLIIHYTDLETKEIIDHKSTEEKKKLLYYKIFLLTSNGNLCCVNISMIFPDFLVSIYKKDYECKEREMLKNMIHIEYEEIKEKTNMEHKKFKTVNNNQLNINRNDNNNNNQIFNYLYKYERKNYEEYNPKEWDSSKNLDIFIFFKNLEFINYDEKYDIFNFRSYYHPNFDFLKSYSNEFGQIKMNIMELVRENYITFEKNKFVIKLQGNYKINIEKNKISSLYFLYLLIYSKCKSMELTGVCLKNNYLSNFMKNLRNVFVK
ncbi:conserved Plasmodium protein, unknown function [Plasmodium relictum]|uniref:Uncharacterized protein n=1 Tax=Plasmodium relictum TaxID=85471 RepID=A0A1J1HEF4_PLARL|nr:conserved Plasmodium protein, unknown function [Plasmodium relictum]CRH01790.1 conserved Plasmodium protein, unknown function [Plasmodium relictum]